MNSIINTPPYPLKRRLLLVIGILVGISTLLLAGPSREEERLTEEEAKALIVQVKKDFDITEEEPVFNFDDYENIEEVAPLKTIKIYDNNDVLLLEAPIHKLEEMQNKNLRKLVNASDFLIEMHNTSYYRLDI